MHEYVKNLLLSLVFFNIGYYLLNGYKENYDSFYFYGIFGICLIILAIYSKYIFNLFIKKDYESKLDYHIHKFIPLLILYTIITSSTINKYFTFLPASGFKYYDIPVFSSLKSEGLCKKKKHIIFNTKMEPIELAECYNCELKAKNILDKVDHDIYGEVDKSSVYCEIEEANFLFLESAIFRGYKEVNTSKKKYSIVLISQFEILLNLIISSIILNLIKPIFWRAKNPS